MIFPFNFANLCFELVRADVHSLQQVTTYGARLNTSTKQFTQGFYHWQRKAQLT